VRTMVGISAATLMLLAACGGGGGGSNHQATCSPSGTQLEITAQNNTYDKDCLAVNAGGAFTITLHNDDAGTPHNVEILTSTGGQLFKGALTTGVNTTTYHVPALKPGTYEFKCEVHPDTMHGTFIVK
jgi:plastocyanin